VKLFCVFLILAPTLGASKTEDALLAENKRLQAQLILTQAQLISATNSNMAIAATRENKKAIQGLVEETKKQSSASAQRSKSVVAAIDSHTADVQRAAADVQDAADKTTAAADKASRATSSLSLDLARVNADKVKAEVPMWIAAIGAVVSIFLGWMNHTKTGVVAQRVDGVIEKLQAASFREGQDDKAAEMKASEPKLRRS
jgi:hypothetical protein